LKKCKFTDTWCPNAPKKIWPRKPKFVIKIYVFFKTPRRPIRRKNVDPIFWLFSFWGPQNSFHIVRKFKKGKLSNCNTGLLS
jgi:hypothetical protein